jgi:hypothetical protein
MHNIEKPWSIGSRLFRSRLAAFRGEFDTTRARE